MYCRWRKAKSMPGARYFHVVRESETLITIDRPQMAATL
jgi:hypothetical protein